jgi:hypothetical protein
MFNIFSTKCKFWKHCKLYREGEVDDTCNKARGWYYGIGRGGGCYRDFEQNGKNSRYWINKRETK